MNYVLKTKNMEMTRAIAGAIELKMATLAAKAKRFGESVTGEVEVGKTTKHHKKGEIFRAEIHIRLPGKLVYAEATGEDLYGAIGEARDEAAKQVQTYKKKHDTLKKQAGKKTRAAKG